MFSWLHLHEAFYVKQWVGFNVRRLRLRSYLIFLFLGIIFIGSSVISYTIANLSTEYNIPKGAIWIELGPRDYLTPNRTRLIVTASPQECSFDLQVYFNFTERREYYICAMLPYVTLKASPYLEYFNSRYTNETSSIGTIKAHFRTFEDKDSSVINATFIPNQDFSLSPNEPIALSISAQISGLISINYPLGSRQTVIMTFFGDQTGVWDDDMANYIGANSGAMIDFPFQIIVQFPKENYLSSDSYPNPIELFITERFRSAIFELDFSRPRGHAQTMLCSYSSPTNETYRQLVIFISGTLLTLGITLCLESYREKRREKEMSQDKKPREQIEETKEIYDQTVLRLIRLVDKNFRLDWVDRYFKGGMVFVFVPFVIYLALVAGYMLLAPINERISIGLSLLAVATAIIALFARFGEEHAVNVNCSRIGICVGEDEKSLLVALIKMKTKAPTINIEQIYNQNKNMFQKDKLLERLYS